MTGTEPKSKSAREEDMGTWATLARVVDRYGFAVIACIGIAWFANSAVTYEREKMVPALENNTKAIERNSEVIRALPKALLKEKIDEENKENSHGSSQSNVPTDRTSLLYPGFAWKYQFGQVRTWPSC